MILETERLILRRYTEDDSLICMNIYPMIKNVYFRTNEQGEPIWKGTYIYGKLGSD